MQSTHGTSVPGYDAGNTSCPVGPSSVAAGLCTSIAGPTNICPAGPSSSASAGLGHEQHSEAMNDADCVGRDDEATSVVNPTTDYRCRENRELKNQALVPETSHLRWRESFNSGGSAILKARFPHLIKSTREVGDGVT